MRQSTFQIQIQTSGRRLYEFTQSVQEWVGEQGFQTGLLTAFVRHTSASLLIQENADPDVVRDLDDFFARLVPEDDRLYRHTVEGPDDMPAHIRTALTHTHLAVPIIKGRLALGTWQGLYLFEHRQERQQRRVLLHAVGE